jgi:hypothetical protein
MRTVATAAALFLAIVAAVTVPAFHDGGVGACNGCHFTHPEEGSPITSQYLLIGENSTDTCLRCHGVTNGNTWGLDLLAPGPVYGGGQFVFLLEDNLNDEPGSSLIISGDHAGHNVISPAMGTSGDSNYALSPGGTYPSSYLTCTSCHDPHGRGNHFRMLYGSDFPLSRSGGYEFSYTTPAIDATGISLFGPPESDSHHTAYRAGTAAWCGNCHDRVHRGSMAGFRHIEDRALASDAVEYNRYQGTGDETGTGVDAYKVLVPYEDVLSPGIDDTGPARSTSRIMCLSCHRAHASSGPYAGRWDFNIVTWADEGMLSGSYPIPNPYPAIGPVQGPLCEKCHGTGEP